MWRSLAAALAAVLLLAGCDGGGPKFKNTDITGADYAKGFALTDHTGKPRTLADFRGKVVVVFFGYAHCPDVCPTTLVELKQVMQALGSDADKVQVVFITLDPERDTPELLKAYMANFDPSFLALIPSVSNLPALAKSFKIYYKKVASSTGDSYTMDHSAGTYVYDTSGRLRLYARYGLGPAAMAADIAQLLK